MITRRLAQADWLLAELDHRRDRWTAERHPLYERWAAGALSAEDLRIYAAEHHHLVATLAELSGRAAALAEDLLHEQLACHAQERERDVERWCRFALATGWGPGTAWYFAADPLAQTEAAVHAWSGDGERTLIEHLVTLYALETAQSDVARPALDGLLGHHRDMATGAARYFELRLEGDAGAAGLLRAALTGQLPVGDPFALLNVAERAYRAHWELVDGLDRFLTASADAPRCRERSAPDRRR